MLLDNATVCFGEVIPNIDTEPLDNPGVAEPELGPQEIKLVPYNLENKNKKKRLEEYIATNLRKYFMYSFTNDRLTRNVRYCKRSQRHTLVQDCRKTEKVPPRHSRYSFVHPWSAISGSKNQQDARHSGGVHVSQTHEQGDGRDVR